ncbi:MAG: 2Fe-2S iron-sulfur cluster-binding protein [Rhodobacteraceae bacterium]|nr:2Fe-2S iron-sulfur cluster-binding protein [Paracoccaceae bacterium]
MAAITFVGAGRTVECPEGQTIFEAASENGLELPIGCRYGGCITCAAKLLSGKVRQPGATALNRRQSRAGFILLCVAKPTSDCVVREGVEVQQELFVNPFSGKLGGRCKAL